MRRESEEQRRIARLCLEAAGEGSGFALAGSGAIREHGLIDRPTEDVDLFTVQDDEAGFDPALERIVAALQVAGHTVDVRRRQDAFAQLTITDPQGYTTDIDLGVDWRAHAPVLLEVGPVLAIDDAVGNKVLALFSRAETRDYLDVDAIRRSGRFGDEELLDLARKADTGFDLEWFAQSLDRVERIQPEEVRIYGLTPGELADVKSRIRAWATDVRSKVGRDGHHTPTPRASR